MAFDSLTRQLERELKRVGDKREGQRGDMELFRQIGDKQTDRWMDLQIYSLSRYRV